MKRTFTMTRLGAALALACCATMPAMAKEVSTPGEARVELARELSSMIQHQAFADAVRHQLHGSRASLADVLVEYTEHASKDGTADAVSGMHDLDRQAIALRGLDGKLSALASVRVHGVEADSRPGDLRDFVMATIVRDPATGTKRVVTFDSQGNEHAFDLDKAPQAPMLIVETDGRAAMQAGMAVLNDELRGETKPSVARFAPFSATGNDVSAMSGADEELTLLKAIYLTKDHEPLIEGDAEIFALVTGIDKQGKAHIVTKQMEWLDHDKRWYPSDPNGSINKDLINWREFGGNFVNLQIFEDDGNTNFQSLAKGLAAAVGKGATLVAPTAPPAAVVAAIAKVGELLVDSMDKKWFQNDHDYVDSIYLIERGGDYGTRSKPKIGVRGEAMVVLEPYKVRGK